MAVFRIEKNKNYTVMANYHLRDISLSLKAKGLLSLMLSLPDGWDYTTKGLACICKDGVDSICSTVKELEKAGYVQRRRLRNELGHLTEIEYTILEKPVRTASSEESALPDSSAKAGTPPKREKPVLDYPVLDNPEQAIPEQDNGAATLTAGPASFWTIPTAMSAPNGIPALWSANGSGMRCCPMTRCWKRHF